jgi:hypothetical protein
VIEPGESVGFTGTASDTEDGSLSASIAWTSDVDGALGTGASLATTALVTSGSHTITAAVTDSGGKSANAQLTIVVNATPTVTISAPADGTVIEPGESVGFTGTASDTEDGSLSASIAWTSDVDGALGTGASLATTALVTSGSHTITAAVTDSGGKSVNAQLTIVVNATPTVTISAPADGTVIEPGESVGFTGTASDTEDGSLSASIVWTSDVDGALGTGASLATTALVTSGSHTITGTVTDSGGRMGSAQLTVIVNASPSVTITAPADSSSFASGEPVNFTGIASDTEDGDVASSISWTSSKDGALGSGGSLSLSTLSNGNHTITASVTDSGGKTATDQITMMVNP